GAGILAQRGADLGGAAVEFGQRRRQRRRQLRAAELVQCRDVLQRQRVGFQLQAAQRGRDRGRCGRRSPTGAGGRGTAQVPEQRQQQRAEQQRGGQRQPRTRGGAGRRHLGRRRRGDARGDAGPQLAGGLALAGQLAQSAQQFEL